jgi:hypothetical protein
MSNVISGVGRSGDMVHKHQTMASDVGFKCVSRPWYDKTTPIGDGIDKILDGARQRDDILCPIKHMRLGINDDNKMVLEYIDGREFIPTEYALKQMGTWYGVPHTFLKVMTSPVFHQNGKVKYQRDSNDAEVLLGVFKNGARRLDQDKQFRFRTYNDGTLRAMLTETYAIIDNVWYLETLQDLFSTIGGDEPRLSHWRGNADTIYGNILLPDTCRAESDSDYGGMLSVSNCEIGTRRLGQTPSVFRAICMNGCIWDQNMGYALNKVHRGEINLLSLRDKIVNNIHDQIPLMQEGVSRFLATKDMIVEKNVKLSNIFALIAYENNMSFGSEGQSSAMVKQYIDHESDNKNLFGIVNAVTRTGQLYNPDEWVRFDEIAGKLINFTPNKWENLQARAKALDVEVFNKVYGIAS